MSAPFCLFLGSAGARDVPVTEFTHRWIPMCQCSSSFPVITDGRTLIYCPVGVTGALGSAGMSRSCSSGQCWAETRAQCPVPALLREPGAGTHTQLLLEFCTTAFRANETSFTTFPVNFSCAL